MIEDKHTDGHALPVQQHPKYHLAVKIVQEREQQRVAERNLRQEEPTNLSSSGRLVDKLVGQIVAMERKINPRLLLAIKLECL